MLIIFLLCLKLYEASRLTFKPRQVYRQSKRPVFFFISFFLSATDRDPDSRKRAINLVMVELLGSATFGYFTRTRQHYVLIYELQNDVQQYNCLLLEKRLNKQ